ncbi:hypothetical protein WR25_14991 [Diploscapter pachys]|uniref:Uncharacterized protein n=1 Tax=Diploscapter pachys TaxID=2018661 RepID=A0A2A2M2B5_9BILA|nr:hypothetical protein WR25_14991 [Diploscapter pachys]
MRVCGPSPAATGHHGHLPITIRSAGNRFCRMWTEAMMAMARQAPWGRQEAEQQAEDAGHDQRLDHGAEQRDQEQLGGARDVAEVGAAIVGRDTGDDPADQRAARDRQQPANQDRQPRPFVAEEDARQDRERPRTAAPAGALGRCRLDPGSYHVLLLCRRRRLWRTGR